VLGAQRPARGPAHGPFNELYDLRQRRQRFWTAAGPEDPVGRFGVLECLDYAWYESLRPCASMASLPCCSSLALTSTRPGCAVWARHPGRRLPPPGRRLVFTQARGRVEAPRKHGWCHPHDLRRLRMSGPFDMHPTTTRLPGLQPWKRNLASDFAVRLWRSFQAGPPGGEDLAFPCRLLARCRRSLRIPQSIFDATTTAFPTNGRRPDRGLPTTGPLQG